MSKRVLIYIVIGWVVLTLIEYYFLPYFIVTLLWVGLSLGLLIISIIQLLKLINERKSLSRLRILKVVIFSVLFYLTFKPWIVNGLIEKVDWRIFYNKRMVIVSQVKSKELNPNVSWNDIVCELPFKFPVLSNGGNEILIYRNKDKGTITVSFFVYRGFFEGPSTRFVYTNDSEDINEFERQIARDPKNNWKILDNWYRTLFDY
jgi:hypothetical protein